MPAPLTLLKVLGKAVLRALRGGADSESLADVLPEVAEDVWDRWRRDRSAEQQRAELLALAHASPSALRVAVRAVVAEVAGEQPSQVRRALSRFLAQVPAAVRYSFRRPADPDGASLPPSLALAGPEDLVPFLPSRLARFHPGDRPLPGIDWELVELLGSGGFGEVWKAKNPHFDAVPPVALKFCLDPSARDRLLRHEAAVLNQVMRQGTHPGVVRLQHTYLGAEPPCLEYEYVPGGTLADVLAEWHRAAPAAGLAEQAGRLVLSLARIVAFAHRLSPPIVHRDLKPSNILVRLEEGGELSLHVTDFGIGGMAAGRAGARAGTTSHGPFLVTALRGAHTPLYASPQQAQGEPPDPRDDVHAIGMIWYQLVTGSLTAGRPGGTRWLGRLADRGLTPEAVGLLGSCIEEDPADRPADAGELGERLAALLGPPARPAPPPAPPPPPPADLPRQLTNSVGMKLVLVPAGTFRMGSPPDEPFRGEDEGPAHAVTVSRPFYLGAYAVTQREYAAVMGNNPADFRKAKGGGPDHPVEQVSWDEAVAFCRKLTARAEERRAGRVYRLPTEAEWEYACRAGVETALACGDSLSGMQANFDGRRPYGEAIPREPLGRTSKVGAYRPNRLGLFDMHGNVWEWCADWYAEDYYRHSPGADPPGPPRGTRRVVRGGSWNNSGNLCRSARRNKHAAHFRGDTVGFRVAVSV